jgi:single-strand DNA-binding protein
LFDLMIIGNLGGDPSLKYTAAGKSVCSFSVAVDTGKKDTETGERETCWVRATAWDKTAELAAEYLRKGNKVFLRGRPSINQWTDKNSGDARATLELNVFQMEFLTPKSQQQDQGDYPAPAAARSPQRPAAPAQPAYDRGDLDDLPF